MIKRNAQGFMEQLSRQKLGAELTRPTEKLSQARFSGPLTLSLSIFVVLPYIIFLIAITTVCFAISYMVFMRQEIRSL